MQDIKELKRKFDNYEITSDAINPKDKIQIARMYEDEIENIRENIEKMREEIKKYENKK